MKNLMRALVVLIVANLVVTGYQAQAQAQSPSSQKRLVKLDETTGELVEVTPVEETSQVAPNAGIVILNNQKSTQQSIQDQQASVIEDSPLSMSSAERRRRDRQALELQTEQKIVEKLEEARMDDERSRSERLFNKGFHSGQQQEQAQAVQVIQAPAPVVVPVEQVKEEPKVNVKEEIRAALDEMKPKSEEPKTSYYVQGLVGIGEYPDAVNVRGNMATGFSFGLVTPERLVAEGTFQFSEYDIEDMMAGFSYGYPPFKTLSQYNFTAAIKYQLLPGKLRPVVGALAGYTYRSYKDQQTYVIGAAKDVSTNAFDVGALVGLDVQLTDSFAIGADLRWMKNIGYRENSNYQSSFVYPRAGKPVEELSYYLGSLTGKFTF